MQVEHVTPELYTLDSLLPVWLRLLLRHTATSSMLMCDNSSAFSKSLHPLLSVSVLCVPASYI